MTWMLSQVEVYSLYLFLSSSSLHTINKYKYLAGSVHIFCFEKYKWFLLFFSLLPKFFLKSSYIIMKEEKEIQKKGKFRKTTSWIRWSSEESEEET